MKIRNGDYLGALNNFDYMVNFIKKAAGDVNEYNYRLFGEYDHDEVLSSYLNDPEVRAIYNVKSEKGVY